jgi:peptidoglycan hydrolase CwlO-like protein
MRVKEVDEVLERNAQLFQQLGTDSTKLEVQAAKVQERKNLRSVRHYAPELVDRLLIDGDK